jgi:hypothetical protein
VTPESFEEIRKRASLARKASKSHREEWKGKEPSEDRDRVFEKTVKEFDAVLQLLKEWRGSAFDTEAAREIGDCLGAKGGTLRDWGRYDQAAHAYDEGLNYEREVEESGGRPNSYCLVQRLVMRVLWQPERFVDNQMILDRNVRNELNRSTTTVSNQMKAQRRGDPWAQADYALVLQLLGEDRAISEWDKFEDMRPDRFVYESTSEVVKLLQERLVPLLSSEDQEAWADVVARLPIPG